MRNCVISPCSHVLSTNIPGRLVICCSWIIAVACIPAPNGMIRLIPVPYRTTGIGAKTGKVVTTVRRMILELTLLGAGAVVVATQTSPQAAQLRRQRETAIAYRAFMARYSSATQFTDKTTVNGYRSGISPIRNRLRRAVRRQMPVAGRFAYNWLAVLRPVFPRWPWSPFCTCPGKL